MFNLQGLNGDLIINKKNEKQFQTNSFEYS